jgi:hypothetical protein
MSGSQNRHRGRKERKLEKEEHKDRMNGTWDTE